MKRSISLILAIMLCVGLSAVPAAAEGGIRRETAQVYCDVLEREAILKEDYVQFAGYDFRHEESLLKLDRVPFSDTVTGTIAFLDLTGDGEAELMFLTNSVVPDLQYTQRKLLNIYTQENGAAKLLYQGQINYNAVGSQTEYEVCQLATGSELYCTTSFAEGAAGSTTWKRLVADGGQITEHVLLLEENFMEDTVKYSLDGVAITASEYRAFQQAWSGADRKGVIRNTDPNTPAMTYDEAIAYLRSVIARPAVSVTVSGAAVRWTDVQPFIDENSRTMVPLRAVAEALGLTVGWDGEMREASFTDGAKTIYFPIGSNTARTSDGGTVQMDTAAVIVNDRTFAPVRYLAEYFGYTVGWDGATRTVAITAKEDLFSGYYDKIMDPCGSVDATADLIITATNSSGQYNVVLTQANGFGIIEDGIGIENNGTLDITGTWGNGRTLSFRFYRSGEYYYLEGANGNFFIGLTPEGPYLRDRGYTNENDAFLAAVGTKKEGIAMCEMGLLHTPVALYDYDNDGNNELLILCYSLSNYSTYLNVFWYRGGQMHWKTDEKTSVGNTEQGNTTSIADIFYQYGMTYEEAINHFS